MCLQKSNYCGKITKNDEIYDIPNWEYHLTKSDNYQIYSHLQISVKC